MNASVAQHWIRYRLFRCSYAHIRVTSLVCGLRVLKPPSLLRNAGRCQVVFVSVATTALVSPSSPSTSKNHLYKKMAEFAGKYKLVSSENFDEYMKVLGVGVVTRKMANAATPVQEIVVTGDQYYIKTSTTFKTTEIKFKLGVEFDESTADGRTVKTTITRDGNKLIQNQKGDKPSVITREFSGDTMKMVLTAGDIVCTRVYKKE